MSIYKARCCLTTSNALRLLQLSHCSIPALWTVEQRNGVVLGVGMREVGRAYKLLLYSSSQT